MEILTSIQRVPRWWIGESTSRYGVLAANTRIIYSISSPELKIREVPWQYLLLCCHPHPVYYWHPKYYIINITYTITFSYHTEYLIAFDFILITFRFNIVMLYMKL